MYVRRDLLYMIIIKYFLKIFFKTKQLIIMKIRIKLIKIKRNLYKYQEIWFTRYKMNYFRSYFHRYLISKLKNYKNLHRVIIRIFILFSKKKHISGRKIYI